MKFYYSMIALAVLATTFAVAQEQEAKPQAPAQEAAAAREAKDAPAVAGNEKAKEVAPAPAKDFSNATLDELNDEIARVSEEINGLFRAVESSENILRLAALNPQYTSDAVEEKRKAVQEAENALIKAQMELRDEISNLPELRKAAAENESRKATITQLRIEKNALVEKYRKRQKTTEAAKQ